MIAVVDAPAVGRDGAGPRPSDRHGLAASLLLLGTAAAAALFGSPGLDAQAALLAAAVLLLGLPHGALDHRIAAPLFRPLAGAFWFAPFLLFYLSLAGFVLAGWRLAPTAAMAGFLLVSVAHFGLGDARGRPGGLGYGIDAAARGAAPVAMAAFAHPVEIIRLFGWIDGDPEGAARLVELIRGPGAMAWATCAAVAASRAIRARDAAGLVELIAVAAVFLACPPLLAFTLYFCGLHSPRALLRGWGATVPRPGALLRAAAPLSLAAAALILVGYMAARGTMPPSQAAVRSIFQWLAALTVPHMVLGALAARMSAATAPTLFDDRERTWAGSRTHPRKGRLRTPSN